MPPPSSVGANATAPPVGEKATIELAVEKFEPPRIALNAVEGWGKTTVGAYSSTNPLMVMCGNETGYSTLLGTRLVPARHRVHATTFPMLLDALTQAITMKFGSIVLDASGGLERLVHEHVCHRDFQDNWGETGFTAFQRGYKISIAEILKVLALLDQIREKAGSTIWIVGHTRTATIKNPMGPDYDQYVSDTHPDTQAAIFKWCDAVFVGKYKTLVDTSGSGKTKTKGKGIGGTERVLYVDGSDAVKAKNRYFMDTNPLPIPEDPTQSAGTIWAAIIKHASTAPSL